MVSQIISNLPFTGFMESRIGGRAENQDSCGFSDTPSGLLVVVCDGMGGGPGGKTASLMAIQTIIEYVKASSNPDRQALLREAISTANTELLKAEEANPALRGMGTTVVAILLNKESAVVAHVGDSRLYKLRDGFKIFRTSDHSMVGELVRRKELTEEQARLSAQSNIITRAIGTSGNSEPDIEEIAFEKGDRFVLCSDGIWGAFPEPKLIRKCSAKKTLHGVVEKIAMETDSIGKSMGGHHDNLTIAIIQTNTDSKKRDKMTKLAKRIILALAALLIVCLGGVIYLSRSQSEIQTLKSQIAELESTNTNREKIIKDLNDKISKQDTELKVALAQLGEVKAQKRTAEAEKEKAEAQTEIANAKAEGAEKRAQEAEAKSKASSKPSSSAANQRQKLKQKLTELKGLTAPDSKQLEKKIGVVKNEILSIIGNNHSDIKKYLTERRFRNFKPVKNGVALGENDQKKINDFISKL